MFISDFVYGTTAKILSGGNSIQTNTVTWKKLLVVKHQHQHQRIIVENEYGMHIYNNEKLLLF